MGEFLSNNKTKIFTLVVAVATALANRYSAKIAKATPTVDNALTRFMEVIKELESVAVTHESLAGEHSKAADAATAAADAAAQEAARAKAIAINLAALVMPAGTAA